MATHDYQRDHHNEMNVPVPFFRREVAGKRRAVAVEEREKSENFDDFLAVRSNLTATNISCINIKFNGPDLPLIAIKGPDCTSIIFFLKKYFL